MTQPRAVDDSKLEAFVGQVVTELGAAVNAPLVLIGDQLGLYRAMADGTPVTPAELAAKTGTAERYVREWLSCQAAGGFVQYEGDGTFSLPPEQAVALTDESSPACVLGGYQAFTAATRITPRLLEVFRSGEGIGWGEHDPGLFTGTARFFRPGYLASLTSEWLPALDGVTDKLAAGGRVADIGCGYGHSTTIIGQAFPHARITGFDAHQPSIDAARKLAADAGVAERVDFEVATAKDFPGTGYDLVTFFDCLHDMGDPVGALRHTREVLADDGTVMLVEPYAGDDLIDNLTPVGRVFYGASTFVCTPASLSEEVGTALGAQAGEARMRDIAAQAGFARFRRATETPFNLVLEARP
ncbi:MAG: class SAM-dependent methyltransferase [Frankiales bacterium]|nr:class SAM-dependent methyltransferase [Frankiales bacterium]